MEMLCVDLWAPQPGNDAKPGGETYAGWDQQGALDRFRAFVDANFAERVTIRRERTVEAAASVPDESLDFAFIDADHTYEGCLADINAWAPKIRRGGMLCGHDVNWPTVRKAVLETGGGSIASDNVWFRFKV
jgi:hypothetical protein